MCQSKGYEHDGAEWESQDKRHGAMLAFWGCVFLGGFLLVLWEIVG